MSNLIPLKTKKKFWICHFIFEFSTSFLNNASGIKKCFYKVLHWKHRTALDFQVKNFKLFPFLFTVWDSCFIEPSWFCKNLFIEMSQRVCSCTKHCVLKIDFWKYCIFFLRLRVNLRKSKIGKYKNVSRKNSNIWKKENN